MVARNISVRHEETPFSARESRENFVLRSREFTTPRNDRLRENRRRESLCHETRPQESARVVLAGCVCRFVPESRRLFANVRW